MSPRLEFEGKDVEKASQKACEELKIPKEKLKYDVISYGATGIFGLVGIKKAKIRVTLPDLTPEDNTEKDLEHNNKSKERATESERSTEQVRPDDKGHATEPERSTEQVRPDDKGHSTEPERSTEQVRPDDKVIASISDESVNLGKNVLQRIIDLITIDAEISFEKKPDKILFYIKGGNAAILIGKQGQTLEAMQYLVEKIVNKHSEQRIRIQIDIEGYLEKRQNSLKRLAGGLAEKAKRSGKPITTGQMNAHDRRIVHLALRDDSGVRTQSLGDGFLKKLLIVPGKKYLGKRKT